METVTAEPTDSYLEIILKADVVTVGTAMRLIDAIAANLDRHPCRQTLVEVVAQGSDVSLTDSYVIWDYAREKSLGRTRLAYVVTGGEIQPFPALTESCATERGTPLKIFTNRKDAMAWLRLPFGTIAGSAPAAATVAVPARGVSEAAHSDATTTTQPTLEHQI